MNHSLLSLLPGLDTSELMYLQSLTQGMEEDQIKQFIVLYQGKRKDPQTLLLLTLVGFLGIAGIQRFVTDQLGMGILYLLTAGFCWIGTIIDVINNKKLALEYNQRQAQETLQMIKIIFPGK